MGDLILLSQESDGDWLCEESEINQAYKERELDVYPQGAEDEQLVYLQNWMFTDDIRRIMGAFKVLEDNQGEVFHKRAFDRKGRCFLSKRAQAVVSASLINWGEMKRHLNKFRLCPYVMAFLECASRSDLINPYTAREADLDRCIKGLRSFVESLREEISKPKFKSLLAKHRRSCNKNFRSMENYIDSLFCVYSRLLVLRIDLGYRKGFFDTIDEGRGAGEDRINYFANIFTVHREKFIRKCQGISKLAMVGHVWKLEYGVEKGYHFHLMLFLNGARVRQDVVIAKKICSLWNDVITDGEGVSYNCNRGKDSYKYSCIGMVNHDDVSAREGFRRAAIYLTKVDRYVSVLLPENRRTFGKGASPKVKYNTTGRPRRTLSQVLNG